MSDEVKRTLYTILGGVLAVVLGFGFYTAVTNGSNTVKTNTSNAFSTAGSTANWAGSGGNVNNGSLSSSGS